MQVMIHFLFFIITLSIGFAVEDNRELDGFCPNEVSINLSVSPADVIYDAKLEFWTRAPTGYSLSETSHDQATMNSGQGHLTNRDMNPISSALPIDEVALKSVESLHPLNPLVHFGLGHSRLRSSSIESFASPIKIIRVCVSPNHENNKILFSLCRVLACNEMELLSLSESPCLSSSSGWNILSFASASAGNISFTRTCRDIRHPINLRNEKEALNVLLNIVQSSLSKYHTSLTQDIKDLLDRKAYPLYSNRRHAKIQVKGEKEILHHFFSWCHVALKVIAVIENELLFEKGDRTTRIEPSFDQTLISMDNDERMSDNQKAIIVRYCYDVLGPLRKEELRKIRSSQ